VRRLGISRATVYSWKARHEDFSRELSAAVQSQRPPQREPIDWRGGAAQLESRFPERWSLPELPFDVGGGGRLTVTSSNRDPGA